MIEKECIQCKKVFTPRYNLVSTQKYCSKQCSKFAANERKKSEPYFVYIDFRNDTLLPFYVGKGKNARIKNIKRNKYHQNIVKSAGMTRIILCCSYDEQFILSEEIRLIRDLKTRDYFGGANYTDGGDATSGWIPSQETRIAIGNGVRGRKRSKEEIKQRKEFWKDKVHPNKNRKIERVLTICKFCQAELWYRASRNRQFCNNECCNRWWSEKQKGSNNTCFKKK